ncbi:MAG: hypothetical protein J0L92_01150 [Deltaproteobacteria bacterium]|nr:hypothetical protein [Deltaproteobacteria bacterium]
MSYTTTQSELTFVQARYFTPEEEARAMRPDRQPYLRSVPIATVGYRRKVWVSHEPVPELSRVLARDTELHFYAGGARRASNEMIAGTVAQFLLEHVERPYRVDLPGLVRAIRTEVRCSVGWR